MHELSIALSLVDAACEQLPDLGAHARVRALHVRVGALSGVVPEALMFSFDVAAAGSAIAGARLRIERVALIAWCEHCEAERALATVQWLRCPTCHRPTPEVRTGRELELVSLEVVDDCPDR